MTLVRVQLDLLSMSIRRNQTTISVILFLSFNLNQKAIELNNAGHIQVTTQNLFWDFFTYIEPFNYAIKSICFDFCSTNVGTSVIGTGRSEGSLLPYFYQFRCHYPLITYLNLSYTPVKRSTFYVVKFYLVRRVWPTQLHSLQHLQFQEVVRFFSPQHVI